MSRVCGFLFLLAMVVFMLASTWRCFHVEGWDTLLWLGVAASFSEKGLRALEDLKGERV